MIVTIFFLPHMFRSNKDFVRQLSQAFSGGNIEFIEDHVADDVRWNIVGMPVIKGKEDFIKVMEMIEMECFPDMSVKNVVAEGNFVVVESTGNIKTKTGKLNNPYLCEVYHIKKGKLKDLTTYVVDASVEQD